MLTDDELIERIQSGESDQVEFTETVTKKRQWQQLHYDMHEVGGASIENDIDMENFTRYLPNAVSAEVLQENERDPEEQMQSLRLITRENIPTVTAILMLGKDTRYWFPGAYIQFVRFDGNEVTNMPKNQSEVRGTLLEQVRELDNILKANLSVALDTRGTTHLEFPDYPYEALRELVRNAIIHRNYESYTPVRVYWFTDKIVINNPGGTYGEVSRGNFGDGITTSYRNPTIAEAMKNMGFTQQFGMGIAKAQKALKDNGNPPVEFNIQDNFIFATVTKKP